MSSQTPYTVNEKSFFTYDSRLMDIDQDRRIVGVEEGSPGVKSQRLFRETIQ